MQYAIRGTYLPPTNHIRRIIDRQMRNQSPAIFSKHTRTQLDTEMEINRNSCKPQRTQNTTHGSKEIA